jgi:uncharacterized repeat protein (TIGR03803 family)
MGPQTFFLSLVRPPSTLVLVLALICVVAPHAMCQQFLDIHDFVQYPNGANPWPLVADSAGNLYGQANGGTYGAGVVFELSPQANGAYSERLLYVFQGVPAVGIPDVGGIGPLVFDSAGNLYGASGGGLYDTAVYGCGTVFELSQSASGTWTKKTIYAFACTPDGNQPNGTLTFDSAGNLYGTTYYGGANNYGTVFELSSNGQGGWTETTLYSFTGSPTEAIPAPMWCWTNPATSMAAPRWEDNFSPVNRTARLWGAGSISNSATTPTEAGRRAFSTRSFPMTALARCRLNSEPTAISTV